MNTDYLQTDQLSLAAALLAVGIPLFEGTPFVKTRTEKGPKYTFLFQSTSACGAFKTGELMRAWEDVDWHLSNGEHPFAYIKCAFTNRERLLDKVNQGTELVMIEKNGKMALISKGASEALQTSILSQL